MMKIESLKMTEHPGDEGPAPPTGQGGGGGPGDWKAPQDMVAPSSWMGLRDPRIVRVPRSLGGKDRHSKVSTIRGLRDRRVRLSVPTALQLYDIQDRLGLSQPSKAVDWLLNNAQHEIDKLPPLQFPPAGSFIQFPPPIAAPHGTDPYDLQPASGAAIAQEMELMRENGSGSLTLLPRDHMGVQMGVQHRPTKWSSPEFPPRARWKESTRGAMDENDGLIRRWVEQDQHHGAEVHSTVVPVHPSLPSMASNNNSYASYYYNLEGSNICVAHVGGHVILPHEEETHGYRPQQLLLCPSGMPSPMFSPYAAAPPADCDPKHANSFHMGSSTS